LGNRSLGQNGAQYEANTARKLGYSPVIYQKGELFAMTIGPFPSKTEADNANIAVRSNIRESAFVVNTGNWCPQPMEQEGYWQCQ
jgi:hypothetical protein